MAIVLNGTTGISSPDFEPTGSSLPSSGAGLYLPSANTVGIATSGTNRLYIDNSGNLGIGTSSPLFALDIRGTNPSAQVRASNAGGTATLNLYGLGSNGTDTAVTQIKGVAESTGPAAALTFSTRNSSATTSERMRIDSSGNLLVGTTSSSVNARAAITQPNDIYYCLNLENTTTGSTPLGIRVKYTASGPNNAGAVFLTAADNSATRFELRSNGGLANFSANNLNLSDERVKTDITPAPSWLAKINAIEVVNFKYKDQTHEDPNLGVIAQQVLSVAPELVDEEGFGETPEDGVPLMAIFETDLKYAMLKAIQELTARLESSEAKNTELENRIAALENK